MSFKVFEKVLDSDLCRIKSNLPSSFSSANFIQVVRHLFPNEYGEMLSESNYRALHTWIARWYLNRHFSQKGEAQITSTMGHKGSNKLWKK